MKKFLDDLRVSRMAEEGFSTSDLEKEIGMSDASCRVYIRRAVQAGDVELAGKRESRSIDGKVCYTPIYRFTKGAVPLRPSKGVLNSSKRPRR